MTEPNPESVDKHDPYVNDKFIDIFRQDEHAELARMFTVGLAINDKPIVVPSVPFPAVPAPAPEGSTMVHPASDDRDIAVGIDKDGDSMRIAYVQGVTQEYSCDAALIFRVTPGGFLMPIQHVPGLIAWLNSRVAKHAKGEL
jgi:hypothetical protein